MSFRVVLVSYKGKNAFARVDVKVPSPRLREWFSAKLSTVTLTSSVAAGVVAGSRWKSTMLTLLGGLRLRMMV